MGNNWDDNTPRWVREGRTGPGFLAPRYAKRADRARVRREWAAKQKGTSESSFAKWIKKLLGG